MYMNPNASTALNTIMLEIKLNWHATLILLKKVQLCWGKKLGMGIIMFSLIIEKKRRRQRWNSGEVHACFCTPPTTTMRAWPFLVTLVYSLYDYNSIPFFFNPFFSFSLYQILVVEIIQ